MNDIHTRPSKVEKQLFFPGGGEMGALMRSKDWGNTIPGSVEKWPQSLLTTLNIILHSKFPMFLWWGPELICFYNDAYRPSLGQNGKHPSILGIPAKAAWPEIWEVIKPLIDQVLNGGDATWSEDQLIPIFRNGKIEDVYWTFSYSPVNDETGRIAGVLVTCNETTDKVRTLKILEESNRRYLNAIHEQTINQKKLRESEESLKELSDRLLMATEGTQMGIWDLDLQTDAIVHSSRLAQIFGNSDGSKNFTHLELRQKVHPDDIHTIVEKSFEDALQTGIYYYEARIIHPDKSIHWIRVRGKVIYDEEHVPIRILGTIIDITESQVAAERVGSLAAIVQSSDDAIIGKDLNGVITSWNAAAERIFGYTADEMIGRPVTILMPPDRVNEEPNILAQLKRGERVDHFETKRISKDKRILDISLTISPVRDGNGNIVGASKIARDITQQKYAERLIIEREQKFRLLADSMPQFVWTADAAGNLNYFNRAILDYSGLSGEELNGEGWLQIVHPDDREENIKLWMHSMATGKDFVFEHRFRAHNGEYRWQLSRAVPQRNSREEIQMWVGTSTDIQEMKELDQQKDYFISLASHELKTPITSIKGYVQILQSLHINGEDVFLKNSLKIIDKQVATLTNLISELLDLSKIKTGSLQLNKVEFKMNDLIEEIIDEIKHIHPDYHIAFSNETEAFVCGDRERIGQVLINFITNAIKYSPGSKKVAVDIFKKDGSVGVSVEDSGIGISKKDQERIFERFYRVEGKNEKTFPGFGIGLFIASEIINRHNGTIGVKSEPGEGSTFYFLLPLDTQND
jgi:PAS domain S-box-containing protein